MPKRLPFLCALGAYKLLRRAFVSLLFSWQVVPRQNSAFSLSRAPLPAVKRSPLLARSLLRSSLSGLSEPTLSVTTATPGTREGSGSRSRGFGGELRLRVVVAAEEAEDERKRRGEREREREKKKKAEDGRIVRAKEEKEEAEKGNFRRKVGANWRSLQKRESRSQAAAA